MIPETRITINLQTESLSPKQLMQQVLLRIETIEEKQIIINLNLSNNYLSSENMIVLMNSVAKGLSKEKIEKILIKQLDLEYNQLTTLGFLTPETAHFFQTLTRLELSENMITSLKQLQQINTQSLQRLNLGSNKISEEEMRNFINGRNLGELRYLLLESNELQNAGFLETGHNMCKLQCLSLVENNISRVDFSQSAFAKSLQKLKMNDNKLQCLPVSLSVFSSLTELNLTSNKIISVQALRFFENLRILNLRYNLITNVKFLSQLNLHNLQQLDLNSNKIVQLSPNSIRRAKLPSLNTFYMYDNLLRGQYYKQLVVGLKCNQLTQADFQYDNCVSLGKFASNKWINENIGWRYSPF